jgi:uncharacterized protein (DUF885 family)
LICAIKLHTSQPTSPFTLEDATSLFTSAAFLGHKAAQAEARRGIYDPGYLNYAVGKLLIEDLKDKVKRKLGDEFTNKVFYDKLLLFGCPPVKVLDPIFLSQ